MRVQNLTISRFKSIRELSIPCRKVNLFIGAPDTGKTNILEALQLMSCLGWGLDIGTSIRLSQNLGFQPLFYRQFLDQPIVIALDDTIVSASMDPNGLKLAYDRQGMHAGSKKSFPGRFVVDALLWVRHYAYLSSSVWTYSAGDRPEGSRIIIPPHGSNFLFIARHDQRVYDHFKEIVSDLQWKIRFDNAQQSFFLSEVRKDDIFDYNLELLSDSLKRLIFYSAILITSESAVLIMDEPDVYAFPPYPKLLGEMIARDASNQFFLTTHNPYFLSALVEKTPATELALFVCRRDPEGGTTVHLLSSTEVERVIEQGANVFFNLEELLRA